MAFFKQLQGRMCGPFEEHTHLDQAQKIKLCHLIILSLIFNLMQES